MRGIYYTARPIFTYIAVVKVLDPAIEECSINERLRHNLSSPSHTLPCEIIPCELLSLVMLFIGSLDSLDFSHRPNSFVLDVYHQIFELQGVEYLHPLQIAHLVGSFSVPDARLVAGKVYLIDFGQSRQLALGPGCHPPIVLPSSQVKKPAGVTMFDPYSFDVH
uniref:Uncharacterized protein n=1 Tax=Ganoderma boninense TaxID=34458 RepID=A0A5K1K0W0_9APHY|nr:Uncharacterized protein [Ganoderma boninense]